jgi:hypothetical protein
VKQWQFCAEVAAGGDGMYKSKIYKQEVAVKDQGLSCDIQTLTTMMLGLSAPHIIT